MEKATVVKTSQEQAAAAWIQQLNQIRLDNLINALASQDINLKNALMELQKLKLFIGDPAKILGNPLTKHGEIAEAFQVYISNIRKLIEGLKPEYTFDGVGRTAPEDYLKNGLPVQSKFYAGETGKNTFNAIKKHLEKYPDFIKNGGIYEIPNDQYEKIVSLLNKPSSELTASEYKLVQAIKLWEKENGISFQNKVKKAISNYKDVQQGAASQKIKEEEENIQKKDQERRKAAYEKSKPTLKEGLHATAASAAIEGGISFCLGVANKLKAGKKLNEFTAEDWKDVGIDTAKGTASGGIRGAAIYAMTNFTATPAAVASSFVTAVLGMVSQAYQLHQGTISTDDFITNSQVICLDVSVSAVSSLLGQIAIPIPIIGTVVGNALGMIMVNIAKDFLSSNERRAIQAYTNDIHFLNQILDEKYKHLIEHLKKEFAKYVSIVDLAFDVDVNIAFDSSIMLADYTGVPNERVLRNKIDIDRYFTS